MNTIPKSNHNKRFKAEYIFNGTWIDSKLKGAATISCEFTLHEIRKYGVKNVIKHYAVIYGIGEKKYNCFIEGFGKKSKLTISTNK